jgi:GT2 family glycosyltransferase
MLSIIIPTCNRNDLLANCLDCLSITNQDFTVAQYEVIVTDDSKVHQARDLILKQYPWVKWVQGPGKGPAANRNNGAKYAKFEWLIFIDDDCLPIGELLNNYYKEIITGQFQAYEGAIDPGRPQKRYDEEAPVNLRGGCFWSCNIAIAKSLFLKVKGFDEGFPYPAMEDTDFYIRVKENAVVKFIPNAMVIHPWRRMVPFTSYKKHLASHQYFENKYSITKPANYRQMRLKILIGHFFRDGIILARYSFKGTGFFLEKVYLNFRLIFQ